MLEGLPFEILHGDEGPALELVNVVNGANVGMIQGRSGPRFALETFEGLRASDETVGKELQGNKAAELGVLGLVDHTHPAAAELFQDAVVRNGSAQHDAHRDFTRTRLSYRNCSKVNSAEHEPRGSWACLAAL
jgi:hypothetical protein